MITKMLLAVPIQYTKRFTALTPVYIGIKPAFDGEPQTWADTNDTIWNIDTDVTLAAKPELVLLNIKKAIENTEFYFREPATPTWATIAEAYAEEEDSWAINTAGDDNVFVFGANRTDQIVAFTVAGITNETNLELYIDSTAGAVDLDIYQILIASLFELPPYDERPKRDIKYPDRAYPPRTPAGQYYPNFREAGTLERIESMNLSWTELTEAQMTTFLDFIDSFGNSFQPFYIIMVSDTEGSSDVFKSTFIPAIIKEDTVQIHRGAKQYWNVSLDILVQKQAY